MVNDDFRNGKAPDDRSREETVDEILSGILKKDGSFNDEFGALLTKYLGDDAAHVASLRGIDLSDRIDEPHYRQRVEYEEPGLRDPYGGPDRTIDRRIEEKMPEDVRYMYSEAAANAQRPEFTSSGNVRYPAMGIGASEERVVYDAEWEERARQEAARLQRVREDRMLRGDSTYVRSFVANGRPMRGGAIRSPYIDPLSADEDFDNPYRYEQKKQEDRQSFFQEGPPVTKARNRAGRQRNTGSAGGRTEHRTAYGDSPEEDMFDSFSDSYESEQAAKAAWLQPDDEYENGRKRRAERRRGQHPQMTSTLRDDYDRLSFLREGEGGRPYRQPPAEPETLTRPPRAYRKPEEEKPEPPKREPVAPEELTRTAKETEGLRTTVAEIVDKYNKRSEEEIEARARELQAKLARQEAERIARENFLKSLPPELVAALEQENAEETRPGSYDDFSGAAPTASARRNSLRAFTLTHSARTADEDDWEALPGDDADGWETAEAIAEETDAPEAAVEETVGPAPTAEPISEETVEPADEESTGPEAIAEEAEEPAPAAKAQPDYSIYLDHYSEEEADGNGFSEF